MANRPILKLVKKDSNVSAQTKPPHISSVTSVTTLQQQPTQVETKPAGVSAEEQAQAIAAATETLRAHNEAVAASMVWTTNPNIIELQPFMSCLCREEDFEEALTTPYQQIYVKTATGYLKHMKLKGRRHIRLPADKLPGKVADPFGKAKAVTEEINFLPAGKIPFKFYNEIVEFFRAVMRLKKSDIEAHAWILWEESKGYYISIPKQKVSKASVEFTYDEDALPAGAIIVVDIHSHNTMGAFYSGTDNNNDKTGVYYSGVVGKLTEKSYEWVMRFNHYEQKKNTTLDEIFDMAVDRPEVPTEWLDKVTFETYQRPAVGFGTYFPKGGNTTPDVSRMGKGSGKSSNEQTDLHSSYPDFIDPADYDLWSDLHNDKSFDQFFGDRPQGRTLMPGAKPNSEIAPNPTPFAEWQKRQQNKADKDLVDDAFDQAQMEAELAARHGNNRANYYTTLQELAELNGKIPEGGAMTAEQEARQEELEMRLVGYVMKMSDTERQELNLSDQAEAFLEKYHAQKDAPSADSLEVTDHSNWPYSAQADAYGRDDEEVILGKGSIFSDSSTDEDDADHESEMEGILDGVDAENCNFPDGDDYNTVAAEHGVEIANSYAIIDTLLTDIEGYDAGLLEIAKVAYQLMSPRAQAEIQTNGIG